MTKPQYTSGPVCLDEIVTVIGQYDPENRWNGWLNPYIDAWSVQETLTAINASYGGDADTYGYDWVWEDDGTLTLTERQWRDEAAERGETYEPQSIGPDEDGLYGIGYYGWTWSEDHTYDEWKAWDRERTRVWVDANNAKNHEQVAAGIQDRRAANHQAAMVAVAEWEKAHAEPPKELEAEAEALTTENWVERAKAVETGESTEGLIIALTGPNSVTSGPAPEPTVTKVVHLMNGDQIVGKVAVYASPDAEPIQIAATALKGGFTAAEVDGERFTLDEIDEWWA